jgi:hypothetical protein
MEADLEKKAEPSDSSLNQEYGHVLTQTHDEPLFTRIIDSFRQNPNARFSPILVDDDGKPLKDQPPAQPPLAMKLKERHLQMIAIGGSIGTCAISLSEPKCSITLKCYFGSIDPAVIVQRKQHPEAIPFRSFCILSFLRSDRGTPDTGTGLFVGSGSALSTGGSAALVISYCSLGIMLFCTVHALGELAVLFPVAGSFSAYSSRFLDPAWGAAMGWK